MKKTSKAKIKLYDVVYTTKSGRVMVAKRIEAISNKAAMQQLKTNMRASQSLNKIVMAIRID